MLKFKQRLTKRQARFTAEVIPGMHAFTTAERRGWTREEAEDYEKFEKLLKVLSVCFRWAESRSPEFTIDSIANLVTDKAHDFREMIADEGDKLRLTQ